MAKMVGTDSQESSPADPQRFAAALARFDQENARDPNHVDTPSGPRPRELVYSEWLSGWVMRLSPDAPEELRLAARAQHLCRWLIPRQSYPMTRSGYLQWRTELKKLHARRASEILLELGYSQDTVTQVQNLILKRGFPQDPLARVLEDALCLVFFEHQFADLAGKTPEDKMVQALVKAWSKMTPAARNLVSEITLPPREKALLQKALAQGEAKS